MTDRNDCNCGDRHDEMPSLLLGNGTRRDFLRRMAAGSLGLFAASGLDLAVAWGGDEPRTKAKAAGAGAKKAKHLIVLWMQGGPSQVDTWDPKPGHKNGGPYKAIGTRRVGFNTLHKRARIVQVVFRNYCKNTGFRSHFLVFSIISHDTGRQHIQPTA